MCPYMKKSIYRLLTIENGIILSSDVLSYLTTKIHTEKELESFFSSFKARFNTSAISIEQVEEILENKQELKDFYVEKSFKFKHKDLCAYYEYLRKRFQYLVTPISLMIDSIESTIFGIVYRNTMGNFVIEDDYDLIEIDFSAVKQDFYLFENMFLGAIGMKSSDKFIVSEFILLEPSTKKNTYLDDRKPKIVIFGETEKITEDMTNVIKSEAPDLTIIFSNNWDYQTKSSVLVIPAHNEMNVLPVTNESRSNPCILDIYDGSIGLICEEMLSYRQNGVFLNKNGLNAMLNSFVSQCSLFPFGSSDFFVEDFPEFYIVAQDSHPFVTEIKNIKFLSISPYEKSRSYAVLDFKNQKYEIRFVDGSES